MLHSSIDCFSDPKNCHWNKMSKGLQYLYDVQKKWNPKSLKKHSPSKYSIMISMKYYCMQFVKAMIRVISPFAISNYDSIKYLSSFHFERISFSLLFIFHIFLSFHPHNFHFNFEPYFNFSSAMKFLVMRSLETWDNSLVNGRRVRRIKGTS